MNGLFNVDAFGTMKKEQGRRKTFVCCLTKFARRQLSLESKILETCF